MEFEQAKSWHVPLDEMTRDSKGMTWDDISGDDTPFQMANVIIGQDFTLKC